MRRCDLVRLKSPSAIWRMNKRFLKLLIVISGISYAAQSSSHSHASPGKWVNLSLLIACIREASSEAECIAELFSMFYLAERRRTRSNVVYVFSCVQRRRRSQMNQLRRVRAGMLYIPPSARLTVSTYNCTAEESAHGTGSAMRKARFTTCRKQLLHSPFEVSIPNRIHSSQVYQWIFFWFRWCAGPSVEEIYYLLENSPPRICGGFFASFFNSIRPLIWTSKKCTRFGILAWIYDKRNKLSVAMWNYALRTLVNSLCTAWACSRHKACKCWSQCWNRPMQMKEQKLIISVNCPFHTISRTYCH